MQTLFASVVVLALLVSLSVAAASHDRAGSLASRPLITPADAIRRELFGTDAERSNNQCDFDTHLVWSTQVGSSIYATPLVTDLFSDGKADIVVPTVTHFLEALDGVTGHDVGRFPFVHPKLRTQCSAVPVDVNRDGINEYMISTLDGKLVFVDEEGSPMLGHTIRIPPAMIKRNWHATADKAHTDAAGLDHHPLEREAAAAHAKMALQAGAARPPLKMEGANVSVGAGRRLLQDPDYDLGDAYDDYYNRMYDDNEHEVAVEGGAEAEDVEIGTDGWLSPEARASMDLVFHPDLYKSSLNVRPHHDPLLPALGITEPVVSTDAEVAVDAHILATPVVVDLNGDGNFDVVVSVTYYFDEAAYERAGVAMPVDDPANYVASGIVCLDLVTGRVRWSHVLHVTTRQAAFPAYSLASPLVINIDADMLLDVFITTTGGLLTGFDANGAVKKGFPVSMGPILGSPIAVDVNGDASADICAADVKGNIACFNKVGLSLAELQIAGSVVATPTAGDVNGDGVIDIVVGTTGGPVYAVDMQRRAVLKGFPVITGGPVVASALVVGLRNIIPGPQERGLNVVVPSNDGFVYIIDRNGCVETIDIAERSYAMVLAADVSGSGKLQLVVATVSGKVSVYETGTPFHPLQQWLSKPNSLNGMIAQEHYMGIFIEPESRIPRDVRGDTFLLHITIYDERPGKFTTYMPRYIVYVMLGRQLVVLSSLLFRPGSHVLRVPAPVERVYTSVHVIMATPNAMRFEDSVSLSFNMHFLDAAKYVLVVPFLLWCLALSMVSKEHTIRQALDPHAYARYARAQRYAAASRLPAHNA